MTPSATQSNAPNVNPHAIGPGVSQMELAPSGTMKPTLDQGPYIVSLEMEDADLTNPTAAPQLQIKDSNGNIVLTAGQPGVYPFAQQIAPYATITVTNTGNVNWRRVSINYVGGERQFL